MVATRSPAGIRYAFALAREAGVPCERLPAGTRWSENGVVAAGYRIDQDDEFVMTANLVRELGDPMVAGISVGGRFTVGDLGIWGYALLSSADAAEALTVALAELRNEVAHTLAVELLSVVGLSVNEVARGLGYSDTTAFSHAFGAGRASRPAISGPALNTAASR